MQHPFVLLILFHLNQHVVNALATHQRRVRSTEEWLTHYLNLSSTDKEILLRRVQLDKGRKRLHQLMRHFIEAGVDSGTLRKVVMSRPQLLSYRLTNIESTSNFFLHELGLPSIEYAALLSRYPTVLMHSVDNRLRPVTSYLQNEIGGSSDWLSWKKVICRYPKIYSCSLNNLRSNAEYLCREDTVNLNRSDLSQVVAKFAPVLWLSQNNLQTKLKFLTESLGLTGSELRSIVVSYPQILGLSVERNLQPKMNFFFHPNTRGIDENYTLSSDVHKWLRQTQLKERVLYQPALLAYSLENRLKPRIKAMQKANIIYYYAPMNLMSYTEVKFQSWLDTQSSTWSISE